MAADSLYEGRKRKRATDDFAIKNQMAANDYSHEDDDDVVRNLCVDSELLRIKSIDIDSADESKWQIRERINQLCNSEGAIRGCGSVYRYDKLDPINSGGFGAVYEAVDRDTGELVAVKEEFEGVSISTLREIDILKSLPPHSSIVEFKGAVRDDDGGVYVVLEHVDFDLTLYMKVMGGLDEADMKSLMSQLLQGVRFLHENKVVHRDIKPGNILVSWCGEVRICDFGLSRRVEAGGQYSPHVGTTWYKAPELLEGVREYTSAVDMWAVGCVMAEVMTNRVLFNGPCRAAAPSWQLQKIDSVIGCRRNGGSGEYLRSRIPCSAQLSDAAFDLLSRFLTRDPTSRITAHSALNHPWFCGDY